MHYYEGHVAAVDARREAAPAVRPCRGAFVAFLHFQGEAREDGLVGVWRMHYVGVAGI